MQQNRFATNEEIPEDGIYYVYHPRHRLIRSVMLRQGDRFPRCSQCSDEVAFELITPGIPAEDYEPLHVYELPLLTED